MSDAAIISLVVGALGLLGLSLGSVGAFSFKLGNNSTRIIKLEEAYVVDRAAAKEERVETHDTIKRIFEKLETMGKELPHQCKQGENIIGITNHQNALYDRMTEHGHRMDRIQVEVADLQKAAIRAS